MDRRTFLKSAGVGVGASMLVGASSLNPLVPTRTRDDAGSDPGPTTTTTTSSPTTTPPPDHRLWTNDLYGSVRGMVTADSELYVSIGNEVYRLAADTGTIAWSAESEQTIEAPVAVGSASVFAVGDEGRVLSVDRSTGDRNWFDDVYVYHASQPFVHEDTLVVPARRVYGFGVDSGEFRWESEPSFTTPNGIRDGPFLYVGDGREFAKLDVRDGSTVWRWDDRDHLDMPGGDFVLDGGRGQLYGTYNSTLFAVDTENGDAVWTHDDGYVAALAQYGDRLLYVTETSADNTKLVAIDLAEPATDWEQIASLDINGWKYGRVTTALAAYEGNAVAGTSTGHLVAVAPADGSLVGATQVAEDALARLHVDSYRAFVSGSGFLRAVDLAECDLA